MHTLGFLRDILGKKALVTIGILKVLTEGGGGGWVFLTGGVKLSKF